MMKNKLAKISAISLSALILVSTAVPANAANYTKNDINNKNRAAVSKSYNNTYIKAMKTPVKWTGKVSGCKAGKTSAEHIKKTVSVVNFYRGLNGLEKVSTTAAYNKEAQSAALMMHAKGYLSHYPTKSWKCFSKSGAKGAGTGNLFGGKGFNLNNSAVSVGAYMTDYGSGNEAVGHRRWLLNPRVKTIGVGTTSSFNAIKVIGTTNHKKFANPSWVAFPNANFSPAQLEPNGRWSITKPNANFAKATVKVYDVTGKKYLKVKKNSIANGYADNTLVFQVSNVGKDSQKVIGKSTVRNYKVKVSNVKMGKKTTSYSYQVKFFDGTKAK